VNDALVQVTSENDRYAVVPEDVGYVAIVKVAPPVVYPDPLATSLLVVYAVALTPSVALGVYSAILNTWVVSELKSKSPLRRPTLNDVHMPCEIAISSPVP
jgi:hypothetical protein